MKTEEYVMPEITVSYKDNVKASERKRVRFSLDAYNYVKPFFTECMEHHEEVYVIFLGTGNKILGVSNLAKGGVDGAVVDIKIILQIALKVHAQNIIVAHNHPGSGILPSEGDKQFTNQLSEACNIIGIKLFDSLIITADTYFSFEDDGLLRHAKR